MTIASLAQLLRRWLVLLVVLTVVGGVLGFGVFRVTPPVYEATVTLLVGQGSTAAGTGSDQLLGAQQLAQTYAEALRTRPILMEAATRARLDLPYAQLLERVRAARVANTQLVRIVASGTTPGEAADYANAVADVFVTSDHSRQASRFATSLSNLSQLVNSIQADIDTQAQRLTALQAEPASAQRDQDIGRVQADLAQLVTNRGATTRSLEDLRVIEAQASNTLTVLEAAAPPETPVRPNRTLFVSVGALIGLLGGLAIVLTSDLRRDRVGSRRRVVELTGAPIVGTIPRSAATSVRRPGRGLSESFRLLRGALQADPEDGTERRSIVVASAGPREGRTTTAAHLAVALAEWGQRVILVDADLRGSPLAWMFDLPDAPGLSALLADPAMDVGEAVSPTWMPGLRVVPAGPGVDDPSMLLSSRRLERVHAELLSQCDVLVYDTPPVLAHPAVAVFAARTDGVLLVVDVQRSRGIQVTRAVEVLADAGALPLGVVINRAEHDLLNTVVSGTYDRQVARNGTHAAEGRTSRVDTH